MLTLIPNPKQVTVKNEARRAMPAAVRCERAAWLCHAEAFADAVTRIYGATATVGAADGVEIVYDGTLAANAYRIDTCERAVLYASADEGVCYGLATLLQLCEAKGEGLYLPSVEIFDAPDRDYRSLMVDIGREWHPFDKLLKFVDLCFFYKVRYFNVHFCDNKLYTLPSRAFPKLNVKGRFYTEEQIAYLREYAKARGVVLIPEFECPGHAPVLNTYYPEVFSDRSDGEGGVFRNELGDVISNKALLCACRESAVEGVKTLLREVAELFPDAPYLHIGGDEPSIALWAQCKDCQAYMQEHGIADVEELFSDYVARMCAYVLTLGKTPIVWEGFPKKGQEHIPKETVVISWENHYQTTEELLSGGFRLLNAAWKPLYIIPASSAPSPHFAWDVQSIFNWNIFNWQHWWEHSKATLNPVQLEPTEQVMGAILCAWEMTFEQEISQIMARLAAFSERTWTLEQTRDYDTFRTAFRRLFDLVARLIQDR